MIAGALISGAFLAGVLFVCLLRAPRKRHPRSQYTLPPLKNPGRIVVSAGTRVSKDDKE